MTLPALKPLEDEVTQTQSVITFSDLSDWRARAQRRIDCVFEKGLPTKHLGVIVSQGGTGKSFLALVLGISVALGRQLLDGFEPVNGGNVLLCFGEDDEDIVSHRIDSVCKAHDVSPDEIDEAIADGRLTFICGRSHRLLSFATGEAEPTPAFRELKRHCEENEYRLVVVDPFIGWSGVPSENDSVPMEEAARTLIDMAKSSGGGVLTLHHANKSGIRSGDDSQSFSRGSTALVDASRWNATLHRMDGRGSKYGLSYDEEHLYAEFRNSKNTNGAYGQTYHLKRQEGGALVSVLLEDKLAQDVARAIVEEVRATSTGLTQAEIEDGTTGKMKDEAEAFQKRLAKRLEPRTVTSKLRKEGMRHAFRTGKLKPVKVEGRPGKQRAVIRCTGG